MELKKIALDSPEDIERLKQLRELLIWFLNPAVEYDAFGDPKFVSALLENINQHRFEALPSLQESNSRPLSVVDDSELEACNSQHAQEASQIDLPGIFVPPTMFNDQLASMIASGAGGTPPRLLCGRT